MIFIKQKLYISLKFSASTSDWYELISVLSSFEILWKFDWYFIVQFYRQNKQRQTANKAKVAWLNQILQLRRQECLLED